MARFQVKTLQLGQNLESFPAGAFQIGGIRIDNPSGSWLYVPNIREYVPPYTQGWERPIQPTTATITVRFTDSPSGSKSVQVGNPVTVTLFDEPIEYSNGVGFTTGAGARVNIVPPFQTRTGFVTAITTGASIVKTVLLTATTQKFVLRQLATTYDLTFGQVAPNPILAICTLFWLIVPTGQNPPFTPTFIWYQGVGPEQVYVSEPVADGGVIVQAGQDLIAWALCESNFAMADGSQQGLVGQVQYYPENV